MKPASSIILCLTAATLLAFPPPSHAVSVLEKQDLFAAGTEGYFVYRVPGLLVTKSGTVLATAEARRGGGGDWDDNDVLLRRSVDGGRTWDKPRLVAASKTYGPGPISNFVMLSDRESGGVHALFCHHYGRVFHMHSEDDGASFSAPVEITPAVEEFRRDYPWRVVATGPDHGTQLRNGRFIVPVWMSDGSGKEMGKGHLGHRPSVVSSIYSDDHGRSWHRGEIICRTDEHIRNPSETVMVELADGRVLFNIRSECKQNRRLVSISPDGIRGWSEPRFEPALLEPICMASLIRLTWPEHGGRSRVLFANPDNLENMFTKPGSVWHDRKRLTVKMSYDECGTWPVSKVLEEGPSGYSDVGVLPDGSMLCIYECGMLHGMFATKSVSVAHFNLEWLTAKEARSAPRRCEFVNAGRALAAIQSGKPWRSGAGWLEGSGTGTYLFGQRLLGAGDFTINVRFSLQRLDGTAASLMFGDNHFGLDGQGKTLFAEGPAVGHTRFLGPSAKFITAGQPVDAELRRRGTKLTFLLAGRELLTLPCETGAVGAVGLRPWRGTMRVYSFSAYGDLYDDPATLASARLGVRIASRLDVNGVPISVEWPPAGLVARGELGVLTASAVQGQVLHKSGEIVWVPRATITPGGDYLVLFPHGQGRYYQGAEMLAYRSTDKGRSWSGPTVAFTDPPSHHGFIPFIPRGSKRLYAFGTQPIPGRIGDGAQGLQENCPIGFRWSDDDGRSWSPVTLIEPKNDPGFTGMSVMRMCETDSGVWLLGAHDGRWLRDPRRVITRQYILRSDDRGRSWTVLPGARPHGWFVKQFDRMEEGRPINVGDGEVLALLRTPEGHLWETRSRDDGQNWAEPKATTLVHPDAPPMVFPLSDGRTLLALIHNRYDPAAPHFKIADRNEIWVSLSRDRGRTWSEPRFVFAGILQGGPAFYHSCSYVDLFADGAMLHLFLGQAGAQLLHLSFRESDIPTFPTKSELVRRAAEVRIAPEVGVGGLTLSTARPPQGLVLREKLGLLTAAAVDGQVVHHARPPHGDLFETRATITPGGDYLLMFPEGQHYGGSQGKKVNEMIAYRSTDHGQTWQGPSVAFNIGYSQHGFIPLIPRGSKRIYAFGTQPIPGKYDWRHGQQENAPIGFRWSDDDGRTWSDVRLIRPVNDPEYKGMSVMRMCETASGAWLLGTHEGDWSIKPLRTRQYILRSEDQGQTWTLLPNKRPQGWYAEGFDRMDEGRPIALGGPDVLLMSRTPEGHLFTAWSADDGRTWTKPAPSPLVHPDAPPMLFHLSDGKTLLALHHNRHAGTSYTGLSVKMEGMKDRSEIWVATSTDQGHTWSEPRFLLANAAVPDRQDAWYNYQCSYMDAFVDGGVLHLFMPHRWQRALHLTLRESELGRLPTRPEIQSASLSASPRAAAVAFASTISPPTE